MGCISRKGEGRLEQRTRLTNLGYPFEQRVLMAAGRNIWDIDITVDRA